MSANDDRRGGAGAAVPAWKLERYVLGELPAEELARLRQRVEVDEDLRRQVAALGQVDAEIRRAYPAPWMARQIRERAARPAGGGVPRPWWQARWPLVPLAAAAMVVGLAVAPLLRSGERDEERAPLALRGLAADGVRVKGTGARLFLHRKMAGGSERLEDGAPARRGDLVRLEYDAAGAVYGAIVSVDGRGAVTRHLPVAGDSAAVLAQGGAVALDSSYELDDAPRWERFFLITSDHPFAVREVLAAAGARGAAAPDSLVLPAGLAQAAVTLTKVEAPR